MSEVVLLNRTRENDGVCMLASSPLYRSSLSPFSYSQSVAAVRTMLREKSLPLHQ
jgi:hypothetical protein